VIWALLIRTPVTLVIRAPLMRTPATWTPSIETLIETRIETLIETRIETPCRRAQRTSRARTPS
jgi:hypothetical protein